MIKPTLYLESVTAAIQEAKEELAWMEFLQRNLEPIQGLENLVALNTLWHYPGSSICLKYIGKGKTEEEAREDLATIMEGFRVIFEDIQVDAFWDRPPVGYYNASVIWEGQELTLRLNVPWLPAKCEVEMHQAPSTRAEVSGRRTYTVVCHR